MRKATHAVSGAAAGIVMLLAFSAPATAQIPLPAPDPAGLPNIFYGAVPPAPPSGTAEKRPDILVFVHGLGGTPDNWWLANNTYQKAYEAGYRTAFIGLSPDNTSNNDSTALNGSRLTLWLPMVAAHYGATKMVLIGHSKGGVDLQVA